MSSSLEKISIGSLGRGELRCAWRRQPCCPAAGEGRRRLKAPPVRGAQPAPSVVVAPVVQKTVPIFSELTARTDASDSVDIRARVKAFLVKQSYEEGKMVRAGQTLFTLDNREYEAQLMQAKAQLAKADADLAQAQEKTVVATAQANLGSQRHA